MISTIISRASDKIEEISTSSFLNKIVLNSLNAGIIIFNKHEVKSETDDVCSQYTCVFVNSVIIGFYRLLPSSNKIDQESTKRFFDRNQQLLNMVRQTFESGINAQYSVVSGRWWFFIFQIRMFDKDNKELACPVGITR
jgi:hypothetical protein